MGNYLQFLLQFILEVALSLQSLEFASKFILLHDLLALLTLDEFLQFFLSFFILITQ